MPAVQTFPNRQNQPMIKYVQNRQGKTKLTIPQNLMEALSMKARLTTLRMNGLRWVDYEISNTLTKCWCSFLTMNFFCFGLYNDLHNLLIPDCSRVPCSYSCFESCCFHASGCCFLSLFIFQVSLLVILFAALSVQLSNKLWTLCSYNPLKLTRYS